MFFLAAFLGWPSVRLDAGVPPKEMQIMAVNDCCGSMKPILVGGETVYVSPSVKGESLVGRIVSTGRALHLVTSENERAVLTTGIANKRSDGWTPREKIQYVVHYLIPKK